MATYPYHTIGSFSFDDASGRWSEAPDSQVLPSFPGLEVSRISLPGVPGELPSRVAANQATTVALSLYVHATVGGIIPVKHAEKLAAIANNLDALYRGLQVASASYSGGSSVPLKRYYDSTDSRTAYGRFEAGGTPLVAPGATYATVSLLFSIPSGTWRGSYVTTAKIPVSMQQTLQDFETSTGPIPDARVVLVGPMTTATVTNAQGYGFTLNLDLASGQWTVVDCANWTYKAPTTGTPSATASATLTAGLVSSGPPLGSALVLTPNASTMPINVSMSGDSGASGFMVRAMPAYF